MELKEVGHVAIDWNPTTPEADEILHKRGITVLWPSSASQTAMVATVA